MRRIGRIGAWLVFWPAGLWLSLNHAARKRHEATLEARSRGTEPSNPGAVRAIADRLSLYPLTNKQRLRMTARAMADVHKGMSVDDAIARQLDNGGIT